MIKTIAVTNHLGQSITLDLRNPVPSGFFIRGVDGLGPSKATINTSESLSIDGSSFNSARLSARNIVFNLGFLENPTIEHSRQKTYVYFPLKKPVEIVVETDNRTLKTNGYVESNEIDIFTKDEGSVISVVCPDPYFYSLATTEVDFSSATGLFEFPFSNESLTEKLIVFGELSADPQKNAYYTGDAPVGITMYIHILGDVGTFTVYNLRTREYMRIDNTILTALTGEGLHAGDDVIISTVKGNKYVTLYRSGIEVNILNALGADSDWITLEPGDNVFYYTAVSGEQNLQFRIEYQTLYEGI